MKAVVSAFDWLENKNVYFICDIDVDNDFISVADSFMDKISHRHNINTELVFDGNTVSIDYDGEYTPIAIILSIVVYDLPSKPAVIWSQVTKEKTLF